MRRIQLYIDEELDDAAEREAARRGMTKSALICRSLRIELGPVQSADDLDELIGLSDADPTDSIDALVYGR